MNMTKEDMLRKIMQTANMVDPAAMSGMNPAAPIENLEINATMSNTTPGGGIDNIASTINDLATSPEGLRAVQENMDQGGMSFDLDKFNANMAAMPGFGITDVPRNGTSARIWPANGSEPTGSGFDCCRRQYGPNGTNQESPING